MKVAAIQMVSGCAVQANLDTAAQLLAEAARQGAELAVLPEFFCLMGHHDTDKLAIQEPYGQGPVQQFLADQARSLGLWLVGLPSPLAIGLVAGLCEFVPYLGVILVAIPTVILGFGQGADTGVLTIIALVVVQQLQGNVVMPIAQKTFGDLPKVFGFDRRGLVTGFSHRPKLDE